MTQRLPPLAALHAFETAARHDSFQRAGEEMHLSAGAVAHQVKQLEAWLGVVLFQRLPRGVVLNAAGRRYAESLRPILHSLAEVSDAARRQIDEKVVTVSATQSFATRWLMPRLGSLREKHPDIDLRVLASTHPADFARDGVDVAIRLGTGPYPGLRADPVQQERFVAVCSPTYAAAIDALQNPADVLRYTLLHDEPEVRIPRETDWVRWLRQFGVTYADNSGPRFSHTYLTLEAAASGQGVAIAPLFLASADLRTGRLVRLFSQSVLGPYRYHLLRAADVRPLVQDFCAWVLHEVARDEQEVNPI
ncbi:MAG TPA: transcriptional regulator GcvA [Burkholderiaceae bacterium]